VGGQEFFRARRLRGPIGQSEVLSRNGLTTYADEPPPLRAAIRSPKCGRWRFAKERLVLAREPAELRETKAHCDLSGACLAVSAVTERPPREMRAAQDQISVCMAHADTPGSQLEASAVTGRRSILACLGVLAALAGPSAWAQTWPNPTDLRDFALAEAHEAKLDARVRRHRRPSSGKWLSTAAIEDTLAASQFRSIARAAKIGHARKIGIALRAWKPELYASWRACEDGRRARAACPGIELQYAHARTAVSYVLAQRAAAWSPAAGLGPGPEGGPPPSKPRQSSTDPEPP
jgi:hypothetical protein